MTVWAEAARGAYQAREQHGPAHPACLRRRQQQVLPHQQQAGEQQVLSDRKQVGEQQVGQHQQQDGGGATRRAPCEFAAVAAAGA